MYRSRGYLHFAWKRLLRVGPAFALSMVLVGVLGGSVTNALYDWAMMGLKTTDTNAPPWSLGLEELLHPSPGRHDAGGAVRDEWICAANYANARQLPICLVTLRFLCGSLLYMLRAQICWSWLLAACALALAIWIRSGAFEPGHRVVGMAMAGPAIACAPVCLGLHTPPVFAWYEGVVGDLSLGICLHHWPIMKFLGSIGLRGPPHQLATLGCAVLLAYLSWHLVAPHARAARVFGVPAEAVAGETEVAKAAAESRSTGDASTAAAPPARPPAARAARTDTRTTRRTA